MVMMIGVGKAMRRPRRRSDDDIDDGGAAAAQNLAVSERHVYQQETCAVGHHIRCSRASSRAQFGRSRPAAEGKCAVH